MIITIDGATGTGKSTVAKTLASNLGYVFFDTGAMYRCVTYGILKHKININDAATLDAFLKDFEFKVRIRFGERYYYVDNEDISLKIRGTEVTSKVSQISAIPAVRAKLVDLQRKLAIGVNAVFEGRDMGTVVFPDAQLKIFLTGSIEVRAARRLAELRAKFPEESHVLTLEQLIKDITNRDTTDSTRETSPLKPASDACVIDTTNLTIDQVVLKILEFKDSIKTRLRQKS